LIDACRNEEDIHDRTALKVFGPNSGLGEHELRRRAKIINYALLYGKTAFTLAKDIGVPQQAAQEFINAYFAGFPSVRKFIDDLLENARRTGVVKTMFGRRRLVPELTNRNTQIRSQAEREAVNMPIQGTAADIQKIAMIRVDAAVRDAGLRARLLLSVHDELLFETPREEVEALAAIVRREMEGALPLTVPLVVDVKVGDDWESMTPLTRADAIAAEADEMPLEAPVAPLAS
jgi:DNA polymerase-1